MHLTVSGRYDSDTSQRIKKIGLMPRGGGRAERRERATRTLASPLPALAHDKGAVVVREAFPWLGSECS